MDIYLAASRLGKFQPLTTSTSVNSVYIYIVFVHSIPEIRSILKDPVLTIRYCACDFVLVFTEARQPSFLRSNASKEIFVVHHCFLRVNFFWKLVAWKGQSLFLNCPQKMVLLLTKGTFV